jgi:hypothetical protein
MRGTGPMRRAALTALVAVGIGVLGVGFGGASTRSALTGSSTTAPRCSKATALAVTSKLGIVPDPTLPSPIAKVLCGPFAGPGSEAMVVSFARGTCLPTSGWAVLRLRGGQWRLAFQRSGFSQIAASGSDIRETLYVALNGDSPCNPTGGERVRTWRWNGSRLVSGPWEQTTVHLYYFVTPSRNISCGVGDEDQASCVSRNRPHSATLRATGAVTICRGSRCVFGNSTPKYPVLAYGQVDEQLPFRCRSETTGVTCVLVGGKNSGQGFFISRDVVKSIR